MAGSQISSKRSNTGTWHSDPDAAWEAHILGRSTGFTGTLLHFQCSCWLLCGEITAPGSHVGDPNGAQIWTLADSVVGNWGTRQWALALAKINK